MTYLILFLLFIYLPAQWAAGASFWESIAPNNPFTFIVWVLFLIVIVCIIGIKAEEDEADKKEKEKLIKEGKLKEGATKKEFEEVREKERVRKENEIYGKKQRWLYCSTVADIINSRLHYRSKEHKILSEEECKPFRTIAQKFAREAWEIRKEFTKGMDEYKASRCMRDIKFELRNVRIRYDNCDEILQKEGCTLLTGVITVENGWQVYKVKGKTIKRREGYELRPGMIIYTGYESWEDFE